ncbi:MAG: glycosyltransferase family 39 protein [Acidobacteriia bacterium]|nr:glycosyltransferase family 39 protein [Terriglobia bacterium]
MRRQVLAASGLVGTFAGIGLLHYPLLRLPYFWDEAGYYVPAALDIYRSWRLIPESTLPVGHTPLVMVYLALAWRAFGFAPLVTRTAMLLIAAATVAATFALARRVVSREAATWSAALLALSPMFFAQSSLVFLDLPAALPTTLCLLALLDGRMLLFALAASLAVLTKETAVVLLPVAWVYLWRVKRAGQAVPLRSWFALAAPILPLAAWTIYYHHATGFWTGNAEYLRFNLYATLSLGRIFWSLLRRLYEVFIGGINWLLVAGAALGIWRGNVAQGDTATEKRGREFLHMAVGLIFVYVLLLSVVGGAVLPRYLLPIFPAFFVAAVFLIWRLRRTLARALCGAALACFVGAWFLNPPYPFPYEDNLSYADFIGLHRQAAQFLSVRPPGERILTAWPATDELTRPFLGYVSKPLRVVPLEGLAARDFDAVSPQGFDLMYLYSRKYEPTNNWLARFSLFRRAQERYFGYAPQVEALQLISRFGVRPLAHFERRGQWVKVYVRTDGGGF